ILLCANSLVTNNSLFDSLPFDGLRDFAPIGQIASAPLVVTVPVDSKIETFGQLLTAARANPGKLTYASAGNGSSSHLAGESLKQVAGIDVLHVPYKGAAPAIADVIGGRISFMTMNTIEITPYVQGHRVKMLAVAALDRIEQYPDL
ncbi:tripartite tricarboxylate transporter substrate-binding protein, partial [Streptomyces albidoflavus]